MKKLLALIFALSLVFALAACNNASKDTEGTTANNTTKEGETTTEEVKTSTFDEFLASLSEKDAESARSYAMDKAKSIDVAGFDLQSFLTKNVFQASVNYESYDDGEVESTGDIYYYLTVNGPVVSVHTVENGEEYNEETEQYEPTQDKTDLDVTVTWETVTYLLTQVKEIVALAQQLDYDDVLALVEMLNANQSEEGPQEGQLVPSDGEEQEVEESVDYEAMEALLAYAETLSLKDLGFELTSSNFTMTSEGVYLFNFASVAEMAYNTLGKVEEIAVEYGFATQEDLVEGSHMGITLEQITEVLTMVDSMIDFSVLFDGQFKGFIVAATDFAAGEASVTATVKFELGYAGNDVASCKLTADFTAKELLESGELGTGTASGHAYINLSSEAFTADVEMTAAQNGETFIGLDLDLTINANGVNGKLTFTNPHSENVIEVKTTVTELAGVNSVNLGVHVYSTYEAEEEGAENKTVDLFKLTVKTNANVVVPDEIKAVEAMDMSEMVKSMADQYLPQVKAMLESLTATGQAE